MSTTNNESSVVAEESLLQQADANTTPTGLQIREVSRFAMLRLMTEQGVIVVAVMLDDSAREWALMEEATTAAPIGGLRDPLRVRFIGSSLGSGQSGAASMLLWIQIGLSLDFVEVRKNGGPAESFLVGPISRIEFFEDHSLRMRILRGIEWREKRAKKKGG